jgi:hypothetical protein
MIIAFPFALASGISKGERVKSHLVNWLGYMFALVYLVIILSTFLSFGIMLGKIVCKGKLMENAVTGNYEFKMQMTQDNYKTVRRLVEPNISPEN